MSYIKEIIQKLYSGETNISINSVFLKYDSLTIDGLSYKCASKRNGNLVELIAICDWKFSLFGPFLTTMIDSDHPNSNMRPAKVKYFMKISFSLGSSNIIYVDLAYVLWCFPHPSKKAIGQPAQVWSHDLFECDGAHSFVPVSLVKSRCAHCVSTIDDEQVLVVVPICE